MIKELEQAINHLEEELKNKQDWSCVACKEEHEQLLGWLKELQVIKNSNPSEALKLFEEFKGILLKNIVFLDTDLQRLNAIEQYILKAQEQEKVLSIIKKKCLTNCNLALVEDNVHYENYRKEFEYFLNKYNESPNGFEITKDDLLTQEEFNIVREWMK